MSVIVQFATFISPFIFPNRKLHIHKTTILPWT